MKLRFRWTYVAFAVMTSMIGQTIHNSLFWAIVDLIIAPLVWFKWLLLHQVNISIIKQTFQWFLQ